MGSLGEDVGLIHLLLPPPLAACCVFYSYCSYCQFLTVTIVAQGSMLIHHHLCSCLSAFSDMPQQVQFRKHFRHRNGITAQYNTDSMSVCQRQQLHWSIIAVHHSMFLRTVLHVKHRNSCPSWPAWYNEFRVGTLLQCSTTDLVTSR